MATDGESALDIILVTNFRNGMYGGYKLGLLNRELSNLEKKLILCTACNGILRDPISVENKLKCKSCLEPNESGEPSISTSIGISDSLKISCPFREKGCVWSDSITNLIDHKKRCQYFLQKYPNCPEMDVECAFKRYGCDIITKRKHMEHHEKESQTKHLKMMNKHIRSSDDNLRSLQSELQTVKSQLQTVNSKLQIVEKEMKNTFGGIVCEIPGLKEKIKINQTYKTKEFYVGLYNFQATIYPRRNNEQHLGIFIQIVRGQFDDKLIWPFSGKISFILLNEANEDTSITNEFVTANEKAFQKYTGSTNNLGFDKLVTHETLVKDEYSKGDTIRIKILIQFNAPQCKIESRSYY